MSRCSKFFVLVLFVFVHSPSLSHADDIGQCEENVVHSKLYTEARVSRKGRLSISQTGRHAIEEDICLAMIAKMPADGTCPANIVHSETYTEATVSRRGRVSESGGGNRAVDDKLSKCLRLLENRNYKPLGKSKLIQADDMDLY
jgi:hypothetical protein